MLSKMEGEGKRVDTPPPGKTEGVGGGMRNVPGNAGGGWVRREKVL